MIKGLAKYMPNYSDKKLVADYLRGNEASLEFLIKKYLKPIYGFVYKYVGNSQEAEDITQEVFLRMWRNIKKFDSKKSRHQTSKDKEQKSFKTWLFSIAKNTSIDFLRKKKVMLFSEFENENRKNTITETIIDPSPLSDELLEKRELNRTLALAMEKLSPENRSVLFLHYNEHFTFRKIAESLGKPLNTIKSQCRRALARLKKILSQSNRNWS